MSEQQTVEVDFVGGPSEGKREAFSVRDLTPRREVAVPPPRIDLTCGLVDTPGRPTFRRAMYVLHRLNGRYEYVHAGTYDI